MKVTGESGLGDANAPFKVYIGNRPDYADFTLSQSVVPLAIQDISAIGQACGNGWRKVFNVYAKLAFALSPTWSGQRYERWQQLRDQSLLQAQSRLSLLFSAPVFSADQTFHLVMGKHYALSLNLPSTLVWLDHEFAYDSENNLIVCPYFDYRQLSNQKIIRLVELIKTHQCLTITA